MSSQQRSLADPRHDEYRILNEANLRDYLAGLPAVAARLGGAPASWTIIEVGDGNLNLVFIVKGTAGGIAVEYNLDELDPRLDQSACQQAAIAKRRSAVGRAQRSRNASPSCWSSSS